MPFDAAKSSVVSAVGQLTSELQAAGPAQGSHMGEKWAKVATAFFSNGTSPLWTDYSAGEAAFKNAAGAEITDASFKAAWVAYAATASLTIPTPPALSYTPPPAPPDFSAIMVIGGQEDHTPSANALFTSLSTWTKTGIGAIAAPPGTQPWV